MDKKAKSGIKPTRIELLKLRKREILAQKGHDLLKEKLDAMVMEFARLVDDYRNSRANVDRELEKAYTSLIRAELISGLRNLELAAYGIPEKSDIMMGTRSVMAVKVPQIRVPPSLEVRHERSYSFAGTSSALDETTTRFEAALRSVLILAEQEGTLRRLDQEIKITRRRVNALESILIPSLQATQKYISMHLEEREREDLFRRKRTKQLLKKGETEN